MKKRIAVLGATGSVGRNTLDVLRNDSDRFEPVLLTAHSNYRALTELKKEFPSAIIALTDINQNPEPTLVQTEFLGKDGLLKAIAAAAPDITVNGIAGAAGLEPSAAAIGAGSDLALANKETIVMAGRLVYAMAAEKKVRIIPMDSEHSAIFTLLEAHGKDNVSEIILTASGGPFRNHTMAELALVRPEQALKHPNWKMGQKISVDSATLANKGLEVIEAAGLFGFAPEKIKVVIHPQSIVHSMIRLADGAIYAQLSKPDMRLPIHDALCWPETVPSPFGTLDFDSLCLNFEKCDTERFPMLALAYEALKGGPLLPVAYNAANEIAVGAFLGKKIGFLEIPRVVEYVLRKGIPGRGEDDTIETVLEKDSEARDLALEYINGRRCNGS